MFLYFVNCLLITFVPPMLLKKSLLPGMGSASLLVGGVVFFAATQLAKMLFLATFIPNSSLGVGIVYTLLRLVVAAADVAGMVGALRWYSRGLPRARILGLAIGWNIGEGIFRRLVSFWKGAWTLAQFDWTYLCQAFDCNASLLLAFVAFFLVEMWLSPKRSPFASPQQPLYLAVALWALAPFALSFVNEWIALVGKLAIGATASYLSWKHL